MTTDTHVLDLLPAYTLGSLDEDERLLVSEHLSACPVCEAQLAAYQALAGELALAVPAVTPSPDLKRRLMARLPASPPNRLSQPWRSWWPWPNVVQGPALAWGIAGFLLILVLAGSNLLLWQRVNQLEAAAAWSGGMRAIPLTSTGLVAGATGFVIISADGQEGAFIVDALPQLDETKQQYQLWLVQNEQRTSGAVFSVDDHGYGGGRIRAPKNLFEYSGCGVSIEPAGGSPSPTGEKVLTGVLK